MFLNFFSTEIVAEVLKNNAISKSMVKTMSFVDHMINLIAHELIYYTTMETSVSDVIMQFEFQSEIKLDFHSYKF